MRGESVMENYDSLQYGLLIMIVLALQCVVAGLAYGLQGEVSVVRRDVFCDKNIICDEIWKSDFLPLFLQ